MAAKGDDNDAFSEHDHVRGDGHRTKAVILATM
jgi:hypothetical protein